MCYGAIYSDIVETAIDGSDFHSAFYRFNSRFKSGSMQERFALSDKAISKLPMMDSGQSIVRDEQLPGFFLVIGARSKTFTIQADLRTGSDRQSLRLKIGDADRMTTREARAKAKVLLGQIANGVDPRPKKDRSPPIPKIKVTPTLRAAWEAYRDGHLIRKGRSQKTIDGYLDHVERLMADWLDMKLSKLGKNPSLVKAKHDALTEDGNPYQANACMRTFRAIYNHARKAARHLPAENPTYAVDWNPETRRNSAFGPKGIRQWFEQAREITNPIRRELHLFLLLSGSRPDPIKKATLDDPNFSARQLFIPRPKGGESRAFLIPLSREMIRCLIRAMRFGRMMHPEAGQTWVFPAESATGHIYEHKEDRDELSHWGNDLRQCYRTLGQAARAGKVDMNLLMNHSTGDVNEGYITRDALVDTHLLTVQQSISTSIFETLRKSGYDQTGWPFRSGRHLLDYELADRANSQQGRGSHLASRNMAVFRRSADAVSPAHLN